MRKIIIIISFYLFFNNLHSLELNGEFYQGNLIIGKTEPGSEILIDKSKIKVSKDGYFAFGLSKDRKNDVIINVVNQNKTETIGSFEVNNQEFKIKKKLPQYGTCAYLINKLAIKYLTDAVRPWGKNIDFLYNSLDQSFNSLAIINPYFQCAGSVDAKDNRDTEFGSLIW